MPDIDRIADGEMDPEHLVAGACQVASRNLSRAEWEENIGGLASFTELCPDQR